MWRRTEFIATLKDTIRRYGCEILSCDGLWGDLLGSALDGLDYEYNIWNMLAGQGLFVVLGNIPYRTRDELEKAKDRVSVFLSNLAISDEIQQEITYFMEKVLLDERPNLRECERLREVIAYANKQWYLHEHSKERCLSVKASEKEFDVENPYDIDKICVSAQYTGRIPDLKYFTNLEYLGILSGISECEIDKLPVGRLQRLSLITKDCHKIALQSETLKEFTIRLGYDCRDEDAKEQVLIDITGMPNLEELDIRFAGELAIKCDCKMEKLISVTITYSHFLDTSWLENMNHLKELKLCETRIDEDTLKKIKSYHISVIDIGRKQSDREQNLALCVKGKIERSAYLAMSTMSPKLSNLDNEPSYIQKFMKNNTYEENFVHYFAPYLKREYESIASELYSNEQLKQERKNALKERVAKDFPFIDLSEWH